MVEEITPVWILFRDQFEFPTAVPLLDLPFATKSAFASLVNLEPDQHINVVLGREAGEGLVLVLVHALDQIVGRTRVKGTVSPTGDDVGEEGYALTPSGSPLSRG